MKRKRLGEVLQDRGKISAESLQELFEEQGGKVIRLGELILERGLVDKSTLLAALEEVSRVPYVDCSNLQLDTSLLKLIPKSTAVRLSVLPVRMEETRIIVVMAEPQNIATIDELRFTTGKDISPRFAFRSEIIAAIERNYGLTAIPVPGQGSPTAEPQEPAQEEAMEFISTSSRQANREAIEEIQAELHHRMPPAVRLVSGIIQKAMDK